MIEKRGYVSNHNLVFSLQPTSIILLVLSLPFKILHYIGTCDGCRIANLLLTLASSTSTSTCILTLSSTSWTAQIGITGLISYFLAIFRQSLLRLLIRRVALWILSGWMMLGRWFDWGLTGRLIFILVLLQKTHGQVFWRITDQVKLGQDQLDLLDKFACRRRLPKFDRLNEGRLESVPQDVGCLNFEDIISQSNQICDSFWLHIRLCLQKCLNFPLLIVAGVQFFVFGACRNDCHILLQLLENFRQKAICRKLNPPFSGIGHNVNLSKLFRFADQLIRNVVKFVESFLELRWKFEVWLVDEMLVWREEGCTQNGVIPVKNDACLMNFWLFLRR